MKAVVLHEYGGPEKLKFEDVDDPVAGEDEVLVYVAAASINPIDWKMRSGAAKERFPVEFPAILGRDVSGTVRAVGAGVKGFAPGDHVFANAWHTYAELCVVKATELAKVPDGMDLVKASAVPLVSLTGEQLVRLGTGIGKDQTVLITGAVGAVGRVAVWTAKQRGAKVIMGVRKSQLDEAKELKPDAVIALDDESSIATLGMVHAIADTVGGATASKLLGKIVSGGVFASVVGPPEGFALHPTIRFEAIKAAPDPDRMLEVARGIQTGELHIPIDRMIALADAGKGQSAAEKGGIGKVLLLASSS